MKNHRGNRPEGQSRSKSGSQRTRDQKPHNPVKKEPQAPRLTRADLYGFHAVREAWLNPERKISTIYVTEAAHEGFKSVIEEGRRKNLQRPPMSLVEKHALEHALPDGAVHQGLALVCSPLAEIDISEMIIRAANQKRSVIVMLDQVTDPHNVGAILRSACAFGASGLVMQRKHAPELAGPAGALLAKTACGAIEHVQLAYETNLSRTIEVLQEAGYFVYALDERGEKNIDDISIADKAVLVLGAEGPGIRHLVKEHCDMLVRLPMSGPMPSINVSNAAAVALYALSCMPEKPQKA